MTLFLEEIKETFSLYQQISMTKDVDVYAIRPRIYKHNSPAGQLKIQIKDTNNQLIAESAWVTITDINSASYSHTYYKFEISAQLKSGENYRIYLINQGYTFSEGNYAGWCMSFDLGKTTPIYTPNTGTDSPFDFELWEKREV
jgi:hypothetical protein